MDIGTHFVTGLVLSSFFESPEAKGACIVGSVIADIALVPIYVHICRKKKTWRPWEYLGNKHYELPPENLMKIYHTVHSLFFLALLFGISFVLDNLIFKAFSVGYLSHIMWDIPTHTKEWASKPLYPFYSLTIEGVDNWWKNRYMLGGMVLIWILLGSLYFFLP